MTDTGFNELSDAQLLRYSRQIMLPQIDVVGQHKLLGSSILVLGAGGLGCPVLTYLATAGVGELVIVDPDIIEISNLQRQILYTDQHVGQYKAEVAAEKIKQLGGDLNVVSVTKIPDDEQLCALIKRADLVIDGTDNFQARYRHNQICVETCTPLVSGAVIRFEGQVSIFDPANADSPCYHCIYPAGRDEALNCSENGVLGPVAGMIATIMAIEAIKFITSTGESLVGRLMLIDAQYMECRIVKLTRDLTCAVCSGK